MGEGLHHAPLDASLAESTKQLEFESKVSVTSGNYRDPDPNIVKWINNKFKDPDENIKATLMKAFEWAGIAKTKKEIDELAKPLEHTGILPPTARGDGPPEFKVIEDEPSEFMERREEELLLELQEGNDAHNELLDRIKNATVRRHLLSPEEEGDLVRFTQKFRQESPDFTPAFKILRVMIGMIQPEDPKNVIRSPIPPDTRDLAPDIYFMLLKEERESTKPNLPPVA
ncbi:MAG TPA: hypothetical protein VIK37_02390 [Candidatus Saccharimonadales bacterium]